MSNLVLFWHRRDLRVRDNLGLSYAQSRANLLVGCFCFDPQILHRDDISPIRLHYLFGCLQELQQHYQHLKHPFLLLQGQPEQVIPDVARDLGAIAVVWNRDVEPYSQLRDRRVTEGLNERGIEVKTVWDQLLVAPEAIHTQAGNPYTVYTPFWKNWQGQKKLDPVSDLQPGEGFTQAQKKALDRVDVIDFPSLKDWGYSEPEKLVITPGERAAQRQLAEFADRSLETYEQQRNTPSIDGTSKLSAALKLGAIGIRRVWQATQEAIGKSTSDRTLKNIQTWQQELAWREFYQHVLYHFPELADGPYRSLFKHFRWDNNPQQFQAWCEGKTGYPIVDAAMRQLNTTGWMHNRCRMIVASFLTKDLIINWQWGERYFMQHLIDGDLAANNGGWQWSASSGMDAKPLRIFNPASQAQKFDPEAKYIRQWLPELKSVQTKDLVTGDIPPLVRQSCNYPLPIVNHNQQQREFKQRYQQVKENL
ncbi:MAG TPA: deoxyribodipyrimidine photolyase [Cyanobacteria bacterium UBA11691]|nr:deoxyribodipyrimidine photolyase [Cyanobacteria bacterium UBA11691]